MFVSSNCHRTCHIHDCHVMGYGRPKNDVTCDLGTKELFSFDKNRLFRTAVLRLIKEWNNGDNKLQWQHQT